MKKNLEMTLLSIIILIMFLIPNCAYADMGAPTINSYTVYVTNPNGINYYTDTGTVAGKYNYGEKIEIIAETTKNNITYGIVNWDNPARYINLADVSKVSKIYSEYNKTKSIDFKVLSENGVEIYSGPAYGYESTGITIPKNTTIKGYYPKDETTDNPWFYVTYNGISGWICELNGVLRI